ncbi:MAG: hypothetical protein MIO88_05505, partial [Methanoregulaceae archaeon]|nr:hypothetical protein [Methanoregulaceae archaeon]
LDRGRVASILQRTPTCRYGQRVRHVPGMPSRVTIAGVWGAVLTIRQDSICEPPRVRACPC